MTAGVLLRFWADSPLWLDEAQSVSIARLPPGALLAALRHDGAPPLYYLLLHAWMGIVGDGDSAARGLSGVFSVAALPLFTLVGIRWGGSRWHGALALAVAAGNPWLIRYATETRMYSLVVLLVLAGVLALEWLRARPGTLPAVVLSGIGGLLLLTHYWAIFLFAVVGVLLLTRVVTEPETGTARWELSALIGSVLPFLPWLPSFLFQIGHTGTPWARRSPPEAVLKVVAEWANGGAHNLGMVALLIWVPALLAVLTRVPVWVRVTWAETARRARRVRTRLPGAAFRTSGQAPRPFGQPPLSLRPVRPVAQPLAAVTFSTLGVAFLTCRLTGSAFMSRYSAVVVPLALMLVVLGLGRLPRTAGSAATGFGACCWLLVAAVTAVTPRTQAGAIATALVRHAGPGDTVVYCPDQLSPAVTHALPSEKLRHLAYPSAGDPTRVDWVDYAERNRTASARRFAATSLARTPAGARIWLVSVPGYRTFGTACHQLARAFTAARGAPSVVVSRDRRVYENASLQRWNPLARQATPGPTR